jgi:hypothetical protein
LSALLSALSTLPRDIAAALTSAADLPRLSPRAAPHPDHVLPLAVPALDGLLDGGLRRGALVELSSRRSTGRFSIGLSALASATQAGEAAALVDLGDHLDPQAAAAEGVDLSRLLWLRPGKLRDALRAAEIVAAAGFPLVVLDLGLVPLRARKPDDARWARLARVARAQRTALLVLSPARMSGTAAQAVLAAAASRPGWSGMSPILTGLFAHWTADKLRGRRPGASARLALTLEETIEREPREKEPGKICLERKKTGGPGVEESTCPPVLVHQGRAAFGGRFANPDALRASGEISSIEGPSDLRFLSKAADAK